DLPAVGEHAGLLVAEPRVVLPAIPQFGDHVGEFVRARVPLPVQYLAVAAEVPGRLVTRGRDDVPAGPAMADVVDRGERARQVVRLLVARRSRCDQADPASPDGDRAEQR